MTERRRKEPPVTEAVRLVGRVPGGFEQWNRSLQGVYLRGARAAHEHTGAICPYIDKRNYCGRLTYSRAFIIAWHEGYSDATSHMNEGGA